MAKENDNDPTVSVPPALGGHKPVIITAIIWDDEYKDPKPGNWKKYDLFKNNWEHNVFIKIGENEPVRMLELLSSKDPNIIRLIFKQYKLNILPKDNQDMTNFINGLYEVIVNKKRNVGIEIAENSVRCIP